MLENLSLTATAPLSITTLLINLGIGVVLSILIRGHFNYFSSTLTNRREFSHVCPFVLLTTVLIITVVKSSLALSLGLVGALSIVRFRTPIKEPEELAYLFIAIALGLGLGADQTVPTVVAGVAILAIMAAFKWVQRNKKNKNLYLSVELKTEPGSSGRWLDNLNQLIGKHVTSSDLRRMDSREENIDATYFIDIENPDQLSALVDELRETFSGIGITFIDQSRMPVD